MSFFILNTGKQTLSLCKICIWNSSIDKNSCPIL